MQVNAINDEQHFKRVAQWVRNQSPHGGKGSWFEYVIVYFSSLRGELDYIHPTKSWADVYGRALGEYIELDRQLDRNENHICICSQKHLYDLHFVQNTRTDNILMIGSDCINKFGFRHVTQHEYRADGFVVHDDDPIVYERQTFPERPVQRHHAVEKTLVPDQPTSCPKESCYAWFILILFIILSMMIGSYRHN